MKCKFRGFEEARWTEIVTQSLISQYDNRFKLEAWISRMRFARVTFQNKLTAITIEWTQFRVCGYASKKSKERRQIISYHRLGYLYRAHPLYILANLLLLFFLEEKALVIMFDVSRKWLTSSVAPGIRESRNILRMAFWIPRFRLLFFSTLWKSW